MSCRKTWRPNMLTNEIESTGDGRHVFLQLPYIKCRYGLVETRMKVAYRCRCDSSDKIFLIFFSVVMNEMDQSSFRPSITAKESSIDLCCCSPFYIALLSHSHAEWLLVHRMRNLRNDFPTLFWRPPMVTLFAVEKRAAGILEESSVRRQRW